MSRLIVVACAAGSVLALGGCARSTPADTKATAHAPAHEWRAEPAMISNFGLYRKHEFVWQDYIYDDKGANTDGRDRFDAPLGTPGADPGLPTNTRQSPAPLINWAGDFLYKMAPGSEDIATVADFIEWRVAADARNVHYRFRMGDMTAPDSAVIALCVDEDDSVTTGLADWPHSARFAQQLGCEHLYTVWGTGGDVLDAAGTTKTFEDIGATVSTDVAEALVEISVPKSFADPGRGRWRYYVASGVWDGTGWEAPAPVPTQTRSPLATGGSPLAPSIYDLLSNNHEPNATWNEEKQANDLVGHNILDDYLDVDFARLESGGDDPDPQLTGTIVRIYRSQYPMEPKRGMTLDGANKQYNGEWVPYTVVIPHGYYDHPNKQYPFDFCMHPLGTNHNVEVFYAEAFARNDYNPLVTGVYPMTGYLGFTQIEALVDRLDVVYACVLGRGEGIGYQGGDGLVDALEVQDEMLKHYRVDLDKRTVHGVSLGAIGTWYVSRLYPDRYSAAMPYIFTTDLATGGIEPTPNLKNLYNLPVFYSIGTFDEFGQGSAGDPMADQMEGFGNEYLYLHYLAREHEGRIEQDFLPFVARLAYPRTRVRDPARVRYVVDTDSNLHHPDKVPSQYGAYWVSDMVLAEGAALGEVDATSLARADQLPKHQVVFRSVYANTVKAYTAEIRGLLRLSQDEFDALWHPEIWEPGWTKLYDVAMDATDLEVPPVSNGFTLKATGLAAVTLDAARMALSKGAHYSVTTDQPLTIHFTDGRTLSFGAAGTFEGSL